MRILPPVYFMGSIVIMGVVHFTVPLVQVLDPPWNLSGTVLLAAGIAIAAAANLRFGRHGTLVHPDAVPSTLVVDGPFRFSRNPMYLGLVCALAGIAMLFGSLAPWLVIPPFVLIIRVRFIGVEERRLEEQFGAAYVAYRRQVRRWV